MLLRRRPLPNDLLTWLQPTNVNLFGGGAAPFNQLDWPVPKGKPFPMDLRTFLNAAEIQLIGQDTFFSGAGIGPDYDYPNPSLRKSYIASINAQPIPYTIAALSASTPFAQIDWPNPKGKQFPVDLRGFVNAAEIQLIGQDVFYAGAGMGPDFDYPNPTLPKSRTSAIVSQPIPNTLPQLFAFPFVQMDWPVPKGKAFPSDLRGFVHASDTRLIGQDMFFAGAGVGPDYDYPNPNLRKSSTAAISSQPIPNNQGTTLFVQTTPFAQTEHPNPVLAKYNQSRMGYVQAARTDLIGKDVFFAGAGQAPVCDQSQPVKAKPQTRVDLPPNLLAAGMLAAPPIQSEQSNRLAAKPQQRVESVPNLLTSTLASNTPFTQSAWDNPQRRTPSIVADRYSNLLLSPLFTTPVGKLLDQPNPVLAKSRGVALNAQQPMNLLETTLVSSSFKTWLLGNRNSVYGGGSL